MGDRIDIIEALDNLQIEEEEKEKEKERKRNSQKLTRDSRTFMQESPTETSNWKMHTTMGIPIYPTGKIMITDTLIALRSDTITCFQTTRRKMTGHSQC